MKTITIKQLHDATGRFVRESRSAPLIVTDRGIPIALLKRFSPTDLPLKPFPSRDPESLPAVAADSTQIISDDRLEGNCHVDWIKFRKRANLSRGRIYCYRRHSVGCASMLGFDVRPSINGQQRYLGI